MKIKLTHALGGMYIKVNPKSKHFLYAIENGEIRSFSKMFRLVYKGTGPYLYNSKSNIRCDRNRYFTTEFRSREELESFIKAASLVPEWNKKFKKMLND